jgi:NDP-sugar pyrophosphorylase family protein
MKANGERVMVEEPAGLWLDIGRREDYEQAIEIFEARRDEFLPPPSGR